ncbi:type IV secretion system protein VirD4 [Rhodopseudomonas rhenobacensis]|uniref:Type IV secretion system protein VirD4 n=1 Tax=Rhodopseudomonas rhenobacensis TaxID=87461 RepID=A0A7W7Z5S7_9BRAD|nr:type IV secretory system conjugative DNA transfer family protein [Rhodopseudomonas rhenobacensis]MBB5048549.1 type IV secretion system protein VirD4 [Rhodopseudomonas rhenobacensis]
MFGWFEKSEREKWASPLPLVRPVAHLGLPALDQHARKLYDTSLPRGVLLPRAVPQRPPVNHWMRPSDLFEFAYQPGQIILGKIAGQPIGYMDDRPLVTIAGARAGKTSTVLEPNLYLYPGSMLVLDPKGELAKKTAEVRRACGHRVHVLDPFGQSGLKTASFNLMAELDPASMTIIDDVAEITQAIIVEDPNASSRHWNDSSRELLKGLILFALTLPEAERNLIAVRQLLTLTHPALLDAVRTARANAQHRAKRRRHSEAEIERLAAVETLTMAMAAKTDAFGGILCAIGKRFANTPVNERGSIFSTAAAQTDFLDSLPMRAISRSSDFQLEALAGDRPTTIYLCLPAGRMETHFRWLRMIIRQACTTLERRGTWPVGKTPILFLLEEFPVLGHMQLMESAAAYFPGFGVKLWAVLQDITQLRRHYPASWETFIGNASVVQCFSNADQATLDYIARRTENLILPFELRTSFHRESFAQLLMLDGRPPAAVIRLEHHDVAALRARVLADAE